MCRPVKHIRNMNVSSLLLKDTPGRGRQVFVAPPPRLSVDPFVHGFADPPPQLGGAAAACRVRPANLRWDAVVAAAVGDVVEGRMLLEHEVRL